MENKYIKRASEEAEKHDYNFPKMFACLGIAGIGIALKIFVPIVPYTETIVIFGLTGALAAIGIKINRANNGGDAWKHEKDILQMLRK